MDVADIGMLEGRGRPRLLDEPLPSLRIARELRGKKLKGHRPLEPRVLGPKDDPHPARVNLVDDPVLSSQKIAF